MAQVAEKAASQAVMPVQKYTTLDNERQVFEQSRKKTFRLPNDTVVKRAILTMEGYAKFNQTTGLPVIDDAGFARAINGITVTDGKTTLKALSAFSARRRSHLLTGRAPRRRVGTGVTKLAAFQAATECPTTGAPFVAPTDGHYVYILEDHYIDFEDSGFGYRNGQGGTLLDLRGNNSARVHVDCGILAAMHETGYAGNAAWSELDINMDLTLVEVPFVEPMAFGQIIETSYPVEVPAGSRGFSMELPRSKGTILDICIQVRNSATAKKFSDTAVKKIILKGDRAEYFDLKWTALQGLNLDAEGPADANMASSKHAFQGFAMYNARSFGRTNTGIKRNELDSLLLYVDTSGSSDLVSETGKIELEISITELFE